MARRTSGNGDQDATGDREDAPQFESGLDYGAHQEDDGAETVALDRTAAGADPVDRGAGEADTVALDRPAAGEGYDAAGSTQAIDRDELGRLAAGDAVPYDERPGAPGARADVVTATAAPEPETAWTAGPGAVPAPVAQDYRGFGTDPADAEDRRRELREAEARAAARDEALEGPSTAPRVLQVLLALFFPVVVLVAAVRLVASPVFLWLEYQRPGFPADPYGFTTEDRLTYGSAGMDYLFNAAPARYLAELRNGGAPLFTDGEVAHMADVKLVMLVTMAVGLVLAVACLAFMVALSRTAKGGIRRALFAGSAWMLVALVALAVLAALGWEQFFAAFHGLFFAEGTWTFRASDALIRLYPGQFWMDAGIAVAAVVLVTLVAVLIGTWPTRRRRRESRLAQQDLVRRRTDWADAA
ncbi:TIGR01906 family membrane protein [Citricoccus sp. SGAir0253]|uniref:TIGR01906 family membrane protein n=1 Tax=Citricoccus sp. SGAir0253 TaxID=2567881 RepID=UPI0010CD25CD|nr:TIGR01906 family membrane protein [Citricoccus sp. SGAir0253]QCU78640.1 TIGR01906 family membrane protein [Citricoccus sp. SGAir0253]